MTQIDLEELNEALQISYCEAAQYYELYAGSEDHDYQELYKKGRNTLQIVWEAAKAHAEYLASQATPTDDKLVKALKHSRQHFETLNFNSEGEYQHVIDEIDEALSAVKVEVQASEAQTDEVICIRGHHSNKLSHGDQLQPISENETPCPSCRKRIAALQRPSVNDDTLLREAHDALTKATRGTEQWLDNIHGKILGPNPGMRKESEETIIAPLKSTIAKLKERLDK